MKISTSQSLIILLILSWIIFVGLSINAGALLVNAGFALFNPKGIKYLMQVADMSALAGYDTGHFFAMTFLMAVVTIMKAHLFYKIIQVLHNKKLNMAQPFTRELSSFVQTLSWMALLIGLFSWGGGKYAEWLVTQGVKMPDVQMLQIGGADVWLFMCVVLFVIAQIFKKGTEIQSENELTV